MVSAVWAFLSTPLGRRIALIGGLVALVALLWIWHQRHAAAAIEAVRLEAINARDEMWRGKLKAAEEAARDTIRRKEAAAYQRAVEDERARAEADAKDVAEAQTIITRVETVSAPARDCKLDKATAAALNELRGEE